MLRGGRRAILNASAGLAALGLQRRFVYAEDQERQQRQPAKIAGMSTELYRVPLAEVLVDAKHGDHSHFELIVARIFLEDGSEGVGYTYTGGKGGSAIYELIETDLKPTLKGKDAGYIEQLWEQMEWHIHYVARGGCASFVCRHLPHGPCGGHSA